MATLKEGFFNLSETLINTLKVYREGGAVLASEGKQETRIKLCLDCKDFKEGRCNLCGCFMDVKVRIEAAKCPAGKW